MLLELRRSLQYSAQELVNECKKLLYKLETYLLYCTMTRLLSVIVVELIIKVISLKLEE